MSHDYRQEGKATSAAISGETVISVAEFTGRRKNKEKAGITDGSSKESSHSVGKGSLSIQRCFTTPDQIIELHLRYYHCRLTFLWVCEITRERLLPRNTMRHTRPIPSIEDPENKAAAFPHYPALRRGLLSQSQVNAVKTFGALKKRHWSQHLNMSLTSRSPPGNLSRAPKTRLSHCKRWL